MVACSIVLIGAQGNKTVQQPPNWSPDKLWVSFRVSEETIQDDPVLVMDYYYADGSRAIRFYAVATRQYRWVLVIPHDDECSPYWVNVSLVDDRKELVSVEQWADPDRQTDRWELSQLQTPACQPMHQL